MTTTTQLADALRGLPDDCGMIEHNPDEGMRMFCCGGEVRQRWNAPDTCEHASDCWYVKARTALAAYDALTGGDKRLTACIEGIGLAKMALMAGDPVKARERLDAISDRLDALTSQLDVDALTQEIRRVDGDHSLAVDVLAEALAPYIVALTSQPSGEAVDREEVLRDYVADYEFLGETEDGRDACYQPNERERLLIEDAIRGWIAFDLPSDHPSADAPGVAVDELASLRAAILRLDGVTRRDCLTAFNALSSALAPKPEGKTHE